MTADTGPAAQPVLQRDHDAVLDCAALLRPDIERRALEGALIDARDAGCPWGWTLVTTAQVLARGETPYDIHNAVRAWRRTHTGRPS